MFEDSALFRLRCGLFLGEALVGLCCWGLGWGCIGDGCSLGERTMLVHETSSGPFYEVTVFSFSSMVSSNQIYGIGS